jgi:hypothetical protein
MRLPSDAEGNAEFAEKLHALNTLNQETRVGLFELGRWEAEGFVFVQLTDDVVHVDLLSLRRTIAFTQLRTGLGLLGKDGLAGAGAEDGRRRHSFLPLLLFDLIGVLAEFLSIARLAVIMTQGVVL